MASEGNKSAIKDVVALMERGWHDDPEQRPRCSDLLDALAAVHASNRATLPKRRDDADVVTGTGARAKRDYEVEFDELELGEELGKGAFGKVWRARFRVRVGAGGRMGRGSRGGTGYHTLHLVCSRRGSTVL